MSGVSGHSLSMFFKNLNEPVSVLNIPGRFPGQMPAGASGCRGALLNEDVLS